MTLSRRCAREAALPQPFGQLLYAIPGTNNVSAKVGVLILAGNVKRAPSRDRVLRSIRLPQEAWVIYQP